MDIGRCCPGSASHRRHAGDGGLIVRTPIDGSEIAGRLRPSRGGDRAVAEADASLPAVARGAGAAPRRAGPPVRRGAARAQGAAGRARHASRPARSSPRRLGEVQEMIDICDFAVGLSRQLYGLTIASERPGHRMMETWHPLGPVGVISAFNFPVAVWAWNAALGARLRRPGGLEAVGEDAADRARLQALFARAAAAASATAPDGLLGVVIGGADAGEALADDPRVPLVSATGSTRMGRAVAPRVAAPLRPLAARARRQQRDDRRAHRPTSSWPCAPSLFAAVGTCGQRCTTLRRLIVHEIVARRARRAGCSAAYAQPADRRSARAAARWSAR